MSRYRLRIRKGPPSEYAWVDLAANFFTETDAVEYALTTFQPEVEVEVIKRTETRMQTLGTRYGS